MDYSRSEIDFMRKDALRRTREMHSHANSKSRDVQAEAVSNIQEKTEKRPDNTSKTQSFKKDPISSIFSGIFPGGKIDNDRLIIIMLIILLAKEGADLKLLIALGYILM